MRLVKIGMVVFSVILGIGIIGTGASLGKLYKDSQLIYETSLEKQLESTALKNVYITTDVPLRIESTTGTPMVTFKSEAMGLIIPEPKYAIEVRAQGDSSYIDIVDENNQFMNLNFGRDEKEAIIYLPEQAIGKLEINGHSYERIEYTGKLDIDELMIDGGYVVLELEGNIGKVELDVDNLQLEMASHMPSSVELEARYGEIDLEGQYKDVIINHLSNGTVKVDSSTRYKAIIEATNADISLNGDIEIAEVYGGDHGEINVQATTQPKFITIESNYGNVNVRLPEGIPGFSGIYEYTSDYQRLISNFEVTAQSIGENTKKINYGDGSTQIVLKVHDADASIIK